MSRRTILAVIVFVLGGIIVYYFTSRQTDTESPAKQETVVRVPILIVHNQLLYLEAPREPLPPVHTVDVLFEVSGILEKSDLTPGMKFNQGQLLAQVDNSEAFYKLADGKRRLAFFVKEAIPVIEQSFPAEKNKWIAFLGQLKPSAILPEFPDFSSPEERYLMRSQNVLPEYYMLKQQEDRMARYFFIAPFDGAVTKVYIPAGGNVGPGTPVATIAEKRDMNWTRYQAPIIRCAIPANALRGNTIQLLNGRKIETRQVTIQETKSDTLYVTGLSNGEQVILTPLKSIHQSKQIVGIPQLSNQ